MEGGDSEGEREIVKEVVEEVVEAVVVVMVAMITTTTKDPDHHLTAAVTLAAIRNQTTPIKTTNTTAVITERMRTTTRERLVFTRLC